MKRILYTALCSLLFLNACAVRTTLDSDLTYFDDYPEVIDVLDYSPGDNYMGFRFHVEDENLLKLTGGIVQGLSGSPILQDGKLIGAVTHVLVNDPTKGYGIFVEEMTANKIGQKT